MQELSTEQKQKLNQYANIKQSIKDLEAQAEEMKSEILAIVPVGVELTTDDGVFVVQLRQNWKYSSHHKEVKEQLKAIEAEEKAKGVAIATASEVLMFTGAKEE